MIKCANPECDNYKQELENNIEVCPSCGKPVEKIESSFDLRRKLGVIVSLVSVIFLIVWIPIPFIFYIRIFVMAACIVVAIYTRRVSAIITTVLSGALLVILFVFVFQIV